MPQPCLMSELSTFFTRPNSARIVDGVVFPLSEKHWRRLTRLCWANLNCLLLLLSAGRDFSFCVWLRNLFRLWDSESSADNFCLDFGAFIDGNVGDGKLGGEINVGNFAAKVAIGTEGRAPSRVLVKI